MSTIQPGRHTVTVTTAEVGESKKKGTPGVFFDFVDPQGDTIAGELWLTENTLERNTNTLREAFGFNDDFGTLPEQCIGKQCSITVELEADTNGKDWPRVKWINPLRTANKPAAGGLLAQLSAKAKAIARPAGAPPANPKIAPATRPLTPSAPKPVTPAADGDEPF